MANRGRKGRAFGIQHEDGSVTLMGGKTIDAETKRVRRKINVPKSKVRRPKK
jgi:hypothetical protein